MAWYITCIVIGIVIGLIISRFLPAMIQYKGKIKQRGQNNTISIKKSLEPDKGIKKERRIKKWRLKRRNKDK